MQVSSSVNAYQYQPNQTQKPLSDSQREVAAGVAGHKSTQAQIDAYISGTQNANENYENAQSSHESTQNYMEFSSDLRKAESYATLVENGVDISDLKDRPSIQPIENPLELDLEDLSQEQGDALRQTATGVAGLRSTQAQIDAYVAGASSESSANPYSSHEVTQDYVNNYNDFSKQVRRSEYLNTYLQNS